MSDVIQTQYSGNVTIVVDPDEDSSSIGVTSGALIGAITVRDIIGVTSDAFVGSLTLTPSEARTLAYRLLAVASEARQ